MILNLFTEKEIREIEEQLIEHEAERFEPYDDATGKPVKDADPIIGNKTIGAGYLMKNDDHMPHISKYTSRTLLRGAILTAIIDALYIFHLHLLYMPKPKRNVLIEFCYAHGREEAEGYVNMIAAVNRLDWKAAAVEMLDSDWARGPVKIRAHKLAHILEWGFE